MPGAGDSDPDYVAIELTSTETVDRRWDTHPEIDFEDSLHRSAVGNASGIVAGRYELKKLLSQGGMGRVFSARHRELGREFALKLVLEGLSHDLDMRERFFREARLASSLNHLNVTSVTDFGLDEQLGYFLVMELLDGETVRQRLKRGRAPIRFACDVMDQVAGAVRYMHGRHVLHCDLKPENIFLTRIEGERRQNVVKLLDFGLAARAEPDQANIRVSGTPPYLAPERLRGEPASPSSDVYSLGMVFYEMLTGVLPFGGSDQEMMDQQLSGAKAIPPSHFLREPVDERIDDIVLRALAPDPAKRIASAEAFHYELRAFMNMMGMRARRQASAGVTSVTALERSPSPPPPVVSTREAAPRESVEALIAASPVPLAVFEPAGAMRFANRTFLLLADGSVDGRPGSLAGLRIARRGVDLVEALHAVVSGRRAAWRLVLAADGEQPLLLMLAPRIVGDRVESVHATLIDPSMGDRAG